MQIFLILPFFLLTLPSPKLSGNFAIFQDALFEKPTVNFNPGDKVYVRIITQSDGEKERSLKLLNEKKEELKTFELVQDKDSDTYSLSFTTPDTPGIYYLKVKIDSGKGTVFSGERNINVGKTGDISVSSRSQNVVKEEGRKRDEDIQQEESSQKQTPLKESTLLVKIRDVLRAIIVFLGLDKIKT